jgi:hypothetical protein
MNSDCDWKLGTQDRPTKTMIAKIAITNISPMVST